MVEILPSRSDRSLRGLVDLEQGLVSREIYVNEEIYQQELEQIFARLAVRRPREPWCRTRATSSHSRMGTEEVLLVRDRKNKIHVFLNTCRHRGMKVCRYDDGNALVFTCPFHAWTYDTDGQLVGVPELPNGLPRELDKGAGACTRSRRSRTTTARSGRPGTARRRPSRTISAPIAPSVRRCSRAQTASDNGLEVFTPSRSGASRPTGSSPPSASPATAPTAR